MKPKEYVKAYLVTEDADGNPIIEFEGEYIANVSGSSGSFTESTKQFTQLRLGEDEIAGIGSNGFVLTKSEAGVGTWAYAPVYDVLTTDSNKKVIYDPTGAQKTVNSVSGDSQNSFNVNFELQSTITKITVSSILFDEDLEVFVYDYTTLSYNMLLEFLMTFDGTSISPTPGLPTDLDLPFIDGDEKSFIPSTGEWPVNKDKYVLTGWDGSVPLKSQDKITGTSVTLDARTNVYNVIFMVNGRI